MNRIFALMIFIIAIITHHSLGALDYNKTIAIIKENQEQLFKLFMPATSFQSYEELKAHLEQTHQKRVQQFDNELIFVIFAPSSVRGKIIKEGFKNQFETNSSKGLFDKTVRFNTERSLLNFSSHKYQNIPNTIRPKYGIVTTKKQLKNIISNMSAYGDDIYILKNTLENRITWTPGDSLNRAYKKCSDYIFDCSCWDEIFIPWGFRHIIIPYLRNENDWSISIPNTAQINPRDKLNPISGSNTASEYMEFQIWGPVFIQDVDSFVYTQKKMTDIEKKELKKASVSCYRYSSNKFKKVSGTL